jgi:hypothetical protein
VRKPRSLLAVLPFALVAPGPVSHPEQRASDADRDTAVDILSEAAADGRSP